MSITHNISNKIFNIKEKLTSEEYKSILDDLAVLNQEETKIKYEFTYVKLKLNFRVMDNVDYSIRNEILHKVKIKPIYKIQNNTSIQDINKLIETIKTQNHNLTFNIKRQYNKYILIITYTNFLDTRHHATTVEGEQSVKLDFHNIIPVSLRKL